MNKCYSFVSLRSLRSFKYFIFLHNTPWVFLTIETLNQFETEFKCSHKNVFSHEQPWEISLWKLFKTLPVKRTDNKYDLKSGKSGFSLKGSALSDVPPKTLSLMITVTLRVESYSLAFSWEPFVKLLCHINYVALLWANNHCW